MKSEFLKAYFGRIHYTRNAEATLDNLKEIIRLHTQTFAFENLNPLLGLPVDLDKETLTDKFVRQGRGGYCFEQNGLLLQVLKEMGYQVRPLLGKVFHPGETIHEVVRTHEILLVELDEEEYLADVGFGGTVPPIPLKFIINRVQEAFTSERYRIIPERDHFYLQYHRNANWDPMYLFDLQEQYEPDFKVANWYTSTHPDSVFKQNLLVSIITPESRIGLRNNKMTFRPFGGSPEVKYLKTPTEIVDALTRYFKINLERCSGLEEKLKDLIDEEAIA